MIAWLKGTVVHTEENEIVLNCGNVGYRVLVGSGLFRRLGVKVGEERELAVYTSVKEDELRLFGFESFLSRRMFSTLLAVSGVGPKVALNVVDQIPPERIVLSIRQNDFTPFLSVSGIGKKTAQRIVLDLQGRLEDWELDEDRGEHPQGGNIRQNGTEGKADPTDEAKSALMNLGFSEREAKRAIGRHAAGNPDLDSLIRSCLADLNNVRNSLPRGFGDPNSGSGREA